jgi:hypothetical protein
MIAFLFIYKIDDGSEDQVLNLYHQANERVQTALQSFIVNVKYDYYGEWVCFDTPSNYTAFFTIIFTCVWNLEFLF